MILELSSPGKGMGSSVWSSGWRGEGLGREWHPGEGSSRSKGFYTLAVSSVYAGSSVGDWAAGQCVLDGVVGCVYGCGRRCQWLNVPIGKVSGSVGVHEWSSSFSSLRSAQRGHHRVKGSWCLAGTRSARCSLGHARLGTWGSLQALSACRGQGQSDTTGRRWGLLGRGQGWVAEWREWRAGWRGWVARRAAYAPSQLGHSPADIGDQRHGGRGRVQGPLLDGVLGDPWSSTGCWLGARSGGEGV
jgi:hypothetical protein